MYRVINVTSRQINSTVVEKVAEWDSKSEWIQHEKDRKTRNLKFEMLLKKVTITAVRRLLDPWPCWGVQQQHSPQCGLLPPYIINSPRSPLIQMCM